MEKGVILPLFYLPPVEYFSIMLNSKNTIEIECHEHFPKQTFRNRAVIYSPNGSLNLIIPVIKGSNTHTKVKDVKISNEFRWRRIHWMSLQTSYRSSSYFEFYEDDFVKFYEKKYDFLFDYNLEILQLLITLLKINVDYKFTEEYNLNPENKTDYRSLLQPKIESEYKSKPYFQLFEDRKGFIPNLSITDLLFSQGPQSLHYI
ncbi:MAG TPA: WbqC family protein [Sphingobacteriaceae bacterium]|nr:WbqC family protein [Sphingobacteriaceae bacterium]